MRQIIRLIGDHFHFLKDHRAFLGHFMFVKDGVVDHIEDDLRAFFDVGADGLDVIAGRLLAGERVHLSADFIHIFRDLSGVSLFGPLEHHMLDEVGYAGIFSGLVAGAGFDPNAESSRLHIIYFFHHDAYAAV